jgi:peptide-methionine (S)-S-oxide reductase
MRIALLCLAGAGILAGVLLGLKPLQPAAAEPAPSSPDRSAAMQLDKATFAAGCFWGVETTFRKIDGVVDARVGYIGGHTVNPTYKQVCTGRTGHAEAVELTFDPAKVSYPELLDAFWSLHDPTTLNRQGPDVGSQYRSAIFFHGPGQEQQARQSLAEVEAARLFKRKIVTEIIPATVFYPAEDYHQQYLAKQGREDACHIGVVTVRTELAATAAGQRRSAAGTQPAER